MKRSRNGRSLVLILLILLIAIPVRAETKVKFVLDWSVIGTHAPFAIALKDKLFEKRGLNVTIDRGYGSTDTINKVANGVYDFGFADPNLLLEYNNKNPDAKVSMVLLVYDGSQSAIVARKSAGIATAKDLEGKKIGAAAGDNTRVMLPTYARLAGFDADKVVWMSVQPQIKETMLVRGDVDAVATLEPTTMMAFKKLGVDPSEYVSFRYVKLMPELMGTGIIASERTIREKPEEVRAFVAAVVDGLKSALADPKAAVASLTLLDPLVDVDNELARFKMGNEMSMANPDLKSSGIGSVAPERMRKSLEYMATGKNIPLPTDMKEIYNQDFLPPVADRMF